MRAIIIYYLAQIFFMQYGTYVAFSWDIMEPIACCLNSFGMLIGYLFWLTTHREMELEGLADNYSNSRAVKIY